jgi:8-oxo-dGTP pyrophosphatase MutT (NUDIX family)
MHIRHSAGRQNTTEIVDLKDGKEYAAVAIVLLRNKIIIEKRTSAKNDPWAGQFSLPGGHYSKGDKTLRDTAIRETLEETGIDLKEGSDYLGHFGPFVPGNRHNLEVYAYVFELHEPRPLVPSEESEYLLWVGLSELLPFNGDYGKSFKIEAGVVWGLTERIIENFLELYDLDTNKAGNSF